MNLERLLRLEELQIRNKLILEIVHREHSANRRNSGKMVSEGKGRLFKRADNKYLVYLPKAMCEDSQFPFKNLLEEAPREGDASSVSIKASFKIGDSEPKLLIELFKEN